MKPEFEEYWKANRARILKEDAEYQQACRRYKMSSGADWLLFAIPIAAGIVFLDYCPIAHELLKWLLGAAVTAVCFVGCVFVKSMITDGKSPESVEQAIKERYKKDYSRQ